MTLVAVLLPAAAAPSAPAALPHSRGVPSIPGRDVAGGSAPADATAGEDMTAVPEVTWPTAAAAVVTLEAGAGGDWRRAGDLPVSVARGRAAPGEAAAAGPTEVGLRMVERSDQWPMAVRVERARGGPVQVRIDYGSFRDAYGGNWASRLQLVRLPECALSTPDDPDCAPAPLATVNDRAGATVTADVGAPKAGDIVALASTPSSDGGNFAATPLQASSTWSGGGSSGDFAWSYPLRTPASLSGPGPTVGVSYSAQSSDGRTSAMNSQPSWVGEGFDFHPGAISRAYKACATDGETLTGDLCWGSDNAVLSMSGRAGELIQASTNPDVWKLRNDDGTRVERLTGAGNGDANGEHWRVTTTDGTQYYFGLNRLPGWTGGKQTGSVATAPVFGNNAGEPCHQSTFEASYCDQAYQWNLDYVVDSHGNSTSYWYTAERNNYARNLTSTKVSSYVRETWLARIEYGTRLDGGVDSALTSTAPMRVLFDTQNRCIVQGSTCVTTNPSNWPDAPVDLICSSATSCTTSYSPTFFSLKMLRKVTTQVAVGPSAYADVDQWTFNHTFKNPGDGHEKILWLTGIVHTGKAGGTTTTMPEVRFNAVQINNRVDTSGSNNPIIRYRIQSIVDEGGAVTAVTYSPQECKLGVAMPASPDSNTMRCYPVYWTPYGATTPRLDWFHRYVVQQVAVSDPTGGSGMAVTTYAYIGPPAWHYDDGEFVPDTHRTWGQWRGYGRVRTTVGASDEGRTQTDEVYFRGMNGDRLASGGSRTVTIPPDPAFGGNAIPDEPWRAGQLRERIVYNGLGDGAAVFSKTLHEPWQHGPHASRTRGGFTVHAYTVGVRSTTVKTALDGGRGWRTTRTTTTFDFDSGTANPVGLATAVDDAGDVATTTDDRCTRTTYAQDAATWTLVFPVRVETVAVACAATPNPATDLISDVRTYYDGNSTFGTGIGKGDVTRTEKVAEVNGGVRSYVQVSRATYDVYGRIVDSFDVLDRKTTTTVSIGPGGTVTGTVTTTPAGWQTTKTVDPTHGQPILTVDWNGNRTEQTYDGLGRLREVWLPGRGRGDRPNMTFDYYIGGAGAPAVASSVLTADGSGYSTAWTIYDGLLRPRQVQKAAPGGGRIITDTIYNSRGLVDRQNGAYFNSASPSGTLFVPAGPVPGSTVTTYDGADRPVVTAFQMHGQERWRTSTVYGGDHVDVTAPPGGTGTSTWTNARGQTTELRRYHGNAPTGAYDAATYTYTKAGAIATMTDATGRNVWRYSYDLRGRTVSKQDPDAGTTTFAYNDADQLVSRTDARDVTVVSRYDELGRLTGTFLGSLAGTQLAGWTYDTLADGVTLVRGQLATATRYAKGSAYTVAITGYDAANRPLGTTVTIPPGEGALAGTYTTSQTYNVDGSVASVSVPAAGGLAAETVSFGYDDGRPTTVSGLTTYTTAATYDPLGRRSELHLSTGNGRTLNQIWTYEDGTNRILEHGVFEAATETVFRHAFTEQDPAGNVKSTKDMLAQYGGVDDTQCFQYDYLRRLSEAWTPKNGDCAATPTGAGLGGPAQYWQSFAYDLTGNRVSSTEHTATTATTRTYTYPAPGSVRPHAVTAVSGAPAGFSYDPAGHTLTRPAQSGTGSATLTWDAEGHLASSTENGSTTSFLYDADGSRLMEFDSTGATLYLAGQELRRTSAGAVSAVRQYAQGDTVVAVRTAAGVTWLVADRHGTAEVAVTANGMQATTRRHKPFGEGRGTSVAWPTDRGFLNGPRDRTGTTHLGAREYDPANGRFLSVDPVLNPGDSQQANGYGYANNNPATMKDPSGMYACETSDCNEPPPSPSSASASPGAGPAPGPSGASERDDPRCNMVRHAARCTRGANPKPWDVVSTSWYTHGTVVTKLRNGRVALDGVLLPDGKFDEHQLGLRQDARRGACLETTHGDAQRCDPLAKGLQQFFIDLYGTCGMVNAVGNHQGRRSEFDPGSDACPPAYGQRLLWFMRTYMPVMICGDLHAASSLAYGVGTCFGTLPAYGRAGDPFTARRSQFGVGSEDLSATATVALNLDWEFWDHLEKDGHACHAKVSVAGSFRWVFVEISNHGLEVGRSSDRGGAARFAGFECYTILSRG